MGTDHQRMEHHIEKMGTLHVQDTPGHLFLPLREGEDRRVGGGEGREWEESGGKMSGSARA